jgi:hypothetical protein
MKSIILTLMGLLMVLLIPSCMEDDLDLRADNSNFHQLINDGIHQENLHAGMHQQMNFTAHLSGDEEVPPADTKAQGQAIFKLEDGMLYYKLIVANIENVRMAHIHMAPAGQNGGVVAWLYPEGPPPQLIEGRFQGVLAEGTITEANLTGPLAGASFEDLIEAIRAGSTYVNVHTNQYPGGEIRGQIK